ncbi:MAG: polyphosphate polymerase domain-containing protein [Clostridia bacterium]|nr:polyphosphate polymerase domain-containing protein [Clostridia bacterium]
MSYQTIFQRHENKYLITREQQQRMLEGIAAYMRPDAYGRSTIRNVYFDTPDHRLIRRSLEKPVYKEKLRVRSYVTAQPDSPVFVEMKKKYKGVVYKRRISLPEETAMAYLCRRQPVGDSQIVRELDWFLDFYGNLRPAMFLSYERQAYYGREDSGLRLTFDEQILWREDRLSLQEPPDGAALLPPDKVLMELKTPTALPLWLTDLLTHERIFRTSFSKYGTAYLTTQSNKEDISHVY